MGLFNFIKSQFIEVIEWADMSPDEMVYRFPVQNKEIKMGAQLTVRESQVAVFINEGLIADIFSPGRHTLSTQNLPILTKIKIKSKFINNNIFLFNKICYNIFITKLK